MYNNFDPNEVFDVKAILQGKVAVDREAEAAERAQFAKNHLGKITVSNFDRVWFATKGATQGKMLKGTETFLYELIGETLSGERAKQEFTSAPTDWGNKWEASAIAEAAKRLGVSAVSNKKTILHKRTAMIGGTPDAIIFDEAGNIVSGIETKCPFNCGVHARNLITKAIPDEYRQQVLGYMWLTGAKSWHFASYDPRVVAPNNLVIVTITRDEVQSELDDLNDRLSKFHCILKVELAKIKGNE